MKKLLDLVAVIIVIAFLLFLLAIPFSVFGIKGLYLYLMVFVLALIVWAGCRVIDMSAYHKRK